MAGIHFKTTRTRRLSLLGVTLCFVVASMSVVLMQGVPASALTTAEAEKCSNRYTTDNLTADQEVSLRNAGCEEVCTVVHPDALTGADGTSQFSTSTCDISKASNIPHSTTVGEITNKTDCSNIYGTWDENATPKCQQVTKKGGDPSCVGGALGWLLCPLVTVFKDLNDRMTPYIEQLLIVNTTTSSSSVDALKSIWGLIVGMANLVLVVAFLIVIFSQATSLGLSAYGIKKMLPRIIAAAILINLSFFICSIAVDIANILGSSVRGIIMQAMQYIPEPQGATLKMDTTTTVFSWLTVILGSIITGGVLVFTGAIAFVLPVIIAGSTAIFILFLGVALRQVLIVLLIVIAPLAFAAMILPNTESLFKKWSSSFLKLLALYPIIMAMIYLSAVVSRIILAIGSE